MTRKQNQALTLAGKILEEEVELSLADLCRASQLPAERLIEWVHEGVVEPVGRNPETWSFHGVSLQRVRCARRLEEDLGVNTAGIALALDLLDEIERLRARLRRFDV